MNQVYQQSIEAVCNLSWPKSKILIQVLDDSDDPTAQWLIKEEVHKWKQDGANIVYRHRVIRDGYKAGNLKSAMNCSYVKDYEYVAIFDADFQPSPDFLRRTVTHFKVLAISIMYLSFNLTHFKGVLAICFTANLIEICRIMRNWDWYKHVGHL